MNKISVNKLIKTLSNRLNDLFKLTYGSDVDEDGKLYTDVYKYEMNELLERVRSSIGNHIMFGTTEFTNIMLLEWEFVNDNFIDIKSRFEDFCYKVYIDSIVIDKEDSSKHDKCSTQNINVDLTDNEYSLLKKTVINNLSYLRKLLINYILKDDSSFLIKMEKSINESTDEKLNKDIKERIERIIEDSLKEYILNMNLAYKLYNYVPTDYDLTFHNRLESYFKLDKNDFIFYDN